MPSRHPTTGAMVFEAIKAAESKQERKAREYDIALQLLAPSNPEETLVGAVNNLRQVAVAAQGNADELERRLTRALAALRSAICTIGDCAAMPVDTTTLDEVLTECSVGVEGEQNGHV